MAPNMNNAAPATAPVTILGSLNMVGSLNMAFYPRWQGGREAQPIAFGHGPGGLSLMYRGKFMPICQGLTMPAFSSRLPVARGNGSIRGHGRKGAGQGQGFEHATTN